MKSLPRSNRSLGSVPGIRGLSYTFVRLSMRMLAALLAVSPAFAQGVRMSADFLPLAVGNRWVYAVTGEDGKALGQVDVIVQDHSIVGGRSFYVVRGFPFGTAGDRDVQLRYDRQERQFIEVFRNQETPLFLNDGATTDVLQTDTSGLPQKFQLKTDAMTLTFQRGVGIVEARMQTQAGARILKIASVRVGQGQGGAGQSSPVAAAAAAPTPPKPPAAQPARPSLSQTVTTADASNPKMQLQVIPANNAHKLVLTVANTSDKLLPFRFTSGQTYDFVVSSAATGLEVWRWSRRMSFTQVIRSDALRAKGIWTFEDTVWNHNDNDGNPAPPGKYVVTGILASQPPLQSEPVTIELQ